MRSKWKNITHSLLIILMIATLVVCCTISIIIFGVTEKSINSFENYIIKQRQQETDAVAALLMQELASLSTFMLNTLSDTSLVCVQHYLDSDILSYSYVQHVNTVQKQLQTIEYAVPLASSIKIYMPDAQRVLSAQSLRPYGAEEASWLDAMFTNSSKSLFFDNNHLYLYRVKQAGALLSSRNTAAVCEIFPDNMRHYVQKYVSFDSSFAVFVQQNDLELFTSFGSLPDNFENHVLQILSSRQSGAEQISVDSIPYLLTWTTSNVDSIKLCQVTPMSFVTNQLSEYRRHIILAMCCVIALLFALVIFLYTMSCSPIRRMKDALGRVETGDLSVRMSPTWSNEFQQIYGQFNLMTERLEQLIDQEYKLKLLKADAELRQMRNQISPHFLYNAYFNLCAMLCDEDYDTATQMAELMGRYLRYITTAVRDEATLGEEMEHSLAYLGIQKLRFGDSLEIRVQECPPQASQILIPCLIIQPLIENSFAHGLRKGIGTGIISVEVNVNEKQLAIIVEDNGETTTDEMIIAVQRRLASGENNPDSTSVALLNIHRRIQILYPEGSGLFVSRSSLGGFRSEIRITGEMKHVSDVNH